MVIAEEKCLYDFVHLYEENQDLMKFKLNVIKFIKHIESDNEFDEPEEDHHNNEMDSQSEDNDQGQIQIPLLNNQPAYEDPTNMDLSSPLGNALFARKKTKNQGLKKMKDVLKPMVNKENGI